MTKSKLLGATALTAAMLFLSACSGAEKAPVETPVETTQSEVETLVTEAATRPGSELMAASQQSPSNTAVTVQSAKEFLEAAETEIEEFSKYAAQTAWVKANFITQDTNALEARMAEAGAKMSTRLSNQAKRFNGLSLPTDMRRKMDGLLRGSNFPAPDSASAAKELAEIMTRLDSAYGTGKFPIDVKDERFISILDQNNDGNLNDEVPEGTIHLGQASDIIAKSDDPDLLQEVWEGWRTVAPQMQDDYAKMVKIINEGSNELGFKDAGDLWRGGYDMDADAFAEEADRLWGQVKPLYDELHCYVRAELNTKYGDEVVPLDGPMRADLLGNMWGQSWGNIYEDVKPKTGGQGVDVTKLLEAKGYDAKKMVETGETFFTSLGFAPLPETFWERSLITKPKDREVVCHASAWNLDNEEDIRIKMCTKVNGEDFSTVHHELGHNFYQRAYKDQPVFFKDGANDGFHEAIGDMIALSITPEYLVKIGLLDAEDVPGEDADLALLMRQAMDKVAFLPFGLMVDQWRWNVFNGTYAPSEYNAGWWELREKYQGLKPPADRPTDAFDPGAKYHIPGNTPYMRYFLAHILQFQFHKAACDQAGFEGPLHRCSVYGNKDVGEKFNAMMEMGSSKPWPDALEAFTGTREMDGSAILEYFEPVMTYLQEENKERNCGW
ncbi:peptidase M2 [Litorimonas cladophorae]|uniref:Peptidase M2 n=2 Tax=Litorimonas cladophorae TaxID=1220491 RepID=A0A918ND61_9PROT|nr:M2 family metallopeptidase [Litorimonas cladophorae]GGX58893.1 peptidase M2 [Litorimonas cladophorae]